MKHNAYILALRHGIELSDHDWKDIEDSDPYELANAILEEGPPFTGSELQFLHELAEEKDNCPIDIEQDVYDIDTLNGYKRFIKNAHYTYKPEAKSIDPTIDPNEEHIGPMAQEIEQVNPAAVIETAEGVKTVDTGRLALMNAGAIADLARQNAKIQEQLSKLLEASDA